MSKNSKSDLRRLIIGALLVVGLFLYNSYLEEPINSLLQDINESDTTINTNKDSNNKDDEVITASREVDSNLSVYFVDVGQADCILISSSGHNMLIDAGNNEDGEKIVTYFKSLGISKFDYVVGTHAHEDHIGGLDNVIRNFDIDTFYMPDVVTTTKTFEEVVDALEEKQIAFNTPTVDNKFKLGDAKFTVIYVGEDSSDLNDTSIVLRMDYGDTSFLFTGDATSKVEKQIIDKNIDVDLLKVGHHGSQYSSSAAFLKEVTPKYAVIQVGENNSYGHPKDVILKRLEKNDVVIYRTDINGTIIAKSDGKNITFTTMETDTNG